MTASDLPGSKQVALLQNMEGSIASMRENGEKAAQAAVATQATAESSTVTAASQEQAARDNNGSGEGKQSEQRQPTMKDVSEINKVINQNTIAEFGYNEPTNRITIKIKDKETNEVIREIPSEKALEMLAKAWELAGIMVDEKR